MLRCPGALQNSRQSARTHGALLCLCIVIGSVPGLRGRSATDGVPVAVGSAEAMAGVASPRCLEIAVSWVFGTPAAGLELLGIFCPTPAPAP